MIVATPSFITLKPAAVIPIHPIQSGPYAVIVPLYVSKTLFLLTSLKLILDAFTSVVSLYGIEL